MSYAFEGLATVGVLALYQGQPPNGLGPLLAESSHPPASQAEPLPIRGRKYVMVEGIRSHAALSIGLRQ